MPKLPSDAATAAAKAGEAGGSTPLEEGIYQARLVEVTAKTASTGNPMWVWVFEITEPPNRGRKQWVNTTLTDAAMWKVAEVFNAFGVPTDTDTDELIGREALLEISVRTITGGAKAGKLGNNVDSVMPLDGAVPATAGAPADGAAASTEAGSGEAPW